MSVHATNGVTAPPGRPPQRPADVIYLSDHKPPLLEDPVAIEVPGDPVEANEEEIGLAAIFEALFRTREQSLADPTTAAAFRTSLQSFLILLDAAQRGGVISPDQYQQLGATLGMADRFPDLI